MKELSIEEKAKALDVARHIYVDPSVKDEDKCYIEFIFPELKESDDERIREEIINYFQCQSRDEPTRKDIHNKWIAWLEKQGGTNEIINRDEFAQGVLRGAAIHLITWIDYNAVEGNMCLSNMECKDIEDALVSNDWDKVYGYMKKKLEKQGEQKPADKVEPIEWSGKINSRNAKGVLKEMLDKKLLMLATK